MILDIAELVGRHCAVPESIARDLRVAFLKTTEPTFLVFAPHQAHPLFAVKVAEASTLERRLALSARLYDLLPDTIARPLGVYPLGAGPALLVQNGLPGLPWFRLAAHLRTAEDWQALGRRCRAQLAAFHAAVATQPEWVAPPRRFDTEMRALTADLAGLLVTVDPRIAAALAEAAETLASADPVSSVWQHGDFVLNNLLVDEHRLGIVDLDDFGKWRAPFVDAYALACSLSLHARGHVPLHSLARDLALGAAMERNADEYTPRQRLAFFAHYLLSAICDTLQRPARATIRLAYLRYLQDLVVDGPLLLRAFEQPPES